MKMKNRLTVFLTCFMYVSSIAQMNLNWSVLHPVKKSWMDLGEKGSVQEMLIEAGELPDPFYGENETKFNWIEEHEWEFKSLFFVDKELNSEFVELIFPSIDTYAKVHVNDRLVLTTENAFLPYSVEVKRFLKKGANEVHIVFTPPVIYHANKKEQVGYELPAPNDVHEISIAPYARKPQYQFGWDWALRMNTIGLHKPVHLHAYNDARLIAKSVRTVLANDKVAVLEMDVYVSDSSLKEIVWNSELFGKKRVKGKNGRFTRREEIVNPNLWWPRGQGEQFLYLDEFNIDNCYGKQIIKDVEVKFGIKSSELIQEKDQWGTSYYFKINGRRVFAKGADYIPQEIFPARVTDRSIRELVETMAESNFNMVRVWGGGYYPDEVFFDACDELGIMVWQDFMFACAMYPGDDAFLANVSKELGYQVARIGGHPSVVLFNGNNEVEVAWGNWGFQVKYGLYGKSAKEIEASYDALFKELAPKLVKEHSNLPYVHTSPLSNWGKMEFYNHGSQHYWGVWHGKDPLEDFGKKIGRFNAEYGFQSFPEYSTLLSFSDTSQWDLSSSVMKHHQKSYVGNDMILKHAKKLYGEPADFEEFVYFSQLTQSMAVSMAVAGHRLDAPRCGGTLYWQLNDCWPAPTWSSIDYYGNWKALQYQMKKDFQAVSVVAKYSNLTDRHYFIVSDAPKRIEQQVNVKVFDLKGQLKGEKTIPVLLHRESNVHLDVNGWVDSLIPATSGQVVFTFFDENDQSSVRSFDVIRSDYSKAADHDFQLTLSNVNATENTAELTLTTSEFLRNCWISSSKVGVRFDRNFESLLPGTHTFHIDFNSKPELEHFRVKWM